MVTIVKKAVVLILFLSGSLFAMEVPVYEKYADEIIAGCVKDMEKEYGFMCAGSGGRMSRCVDSIKICFHSYRRTTLQEAREMIVKAKQKLVERVNAHEKIRPFLKEYPFTLHSAEISIAFYKPRSSSHYLDESVAFVCSSKMGENIAYDRAEIQTRTLLGLIDQKGNILIPPKDIEDEVFVPILEESCEEAVRIVKTKQNGKEKL